ncbi:MAG TPA: hypothetical protein VNT75_03085, partial [Symbiobacteriaceae bacterium]|nr:hypothetical protein [Symbiobacteriaceae bacterium]
LAVFRSHPAMPLKLQHLADWQVGWDPLARSMALVTARLGVSLEQCVYVTANPAAALDAASAFPALRTVVLPADPAGAGPYLARIWAFDGQEGGV